jgi:molecular chaperone GrpE
MTEQGKPTPETNNPPPGNNGAGPESAPPGEIEGLRTRLQAAEKARDEYLTLVKQTRAEFENYQKRNARDMAAERRFAQTPLASDLLPALDNLERAIAAAGQFENRGSLAQGVAMVQAQLLDALRRHGVTSIEAQGLPFDPHLHQAVMQQPSAEVPPQTVLQVLESGYMLHDRVLRPARVVVSMPPT